MVRFGILGCGRIGQVHASSIQRIPNARLVAVADVSPEAAQACGERFAVEVRDASAIVSAADIDAVIIATSTNTHYDMIHLAAGGGRAIFCEKPIDLSSEKVRVCIKAVEDAGVPFMTAFNQRFDPHFGAIQRRIAEGEIGDIETVSIVSRDPAPPPVSYLKGSGGLFRDMMIHDLDMARFILGEEPTRVFAVGSTLVDLVIAEVGMSTPPLPAKFARSATLEGRDTDTTSGLRSMVQRACCEPPTSWRIRSRVRLRKASLSLRPRPSSSSGLARHIALSCSILSMRSSKDASQGPMPRTA